MFPTSVTWNSKYSTFDKFRRSVVGHLLQAGCGYLVNDTVVQGYKAQGEAYFTTGTFYERHHTEPVQVTYDLEYFFGILLAACRNRSNRLIAKYECNNCYNGMLLWHDIVTEYAHYGSVENTMFRISDKLRVIPVNDVGSTDELLVFLDNYEVDLLTLKTLQGDDFWATTWKSRFLHMFDYVAKYEYAYVVQKCRDNPTDDVFSSISLLRSNVLFCYEGESNS